MTNAPIRIMRRLSTMLHNACVVNNGINIHHIIWLLLTTRMLVLTYGQHRLQTLEPTLALTIGSNVCFKYWMHCVTPA